MKKETVNIFSEGLNKDLNPLVTPNNVLTDNLNGTFITFNGDELSLQNDAGNTRIPGPDGIDFVRLSEGFEPLGMKEYGGVLYIVSGKKGFNEIGGRDPNKDEIEFGSYPSPENAGYTVFHGEKSTELSNTADVLYKSYIINNDYFKTGRFISFRPGTTYDLSNVQTYDDLNKLYIIKLYLQLDNGMLDLTDDIWKKFNFYKEQHQEDTTPHWILSENFEYYCPYSYKGRLAVKVIMSEPVFKLIKTSDISIVNDYYSISFDIDIENTTALSISKYTVNYKYDNDAEWTPIENSNLVPGTNTTTIGNIPINTEVLHYNIIPEFKYGLNTILSWEDLPFEFKELYTIQENIMLYEQNRNIGLVHGDYECIPEKGMKRAKALILSGSEGPLTPDFSYDLVSDTNPLGLHYAYLLEGHSNSDYISLGTFIINNGYAEITQHNSWSDPNSPYQALIESIAERSPVEVFDSSCSDAILHLRFSAPLDMADANTLKNGYLTVYQSSSRSPKALTYESYDGRNFFIRINAENNVNITFNNPGFGSFGYIIEKDVLDLSKTYEIGLAVKFENEYVYDIISGQTSFEFMTENIDLRATQLGYYIHDKFATNVDGYNIRPVESSAIYSFVENRISFMEGSYAGFFYTTVKDETYTLDKAVDYPYKLTDSYGNTLSSNIGADEYIVITTSGAPRGYTAVANNYFKIGTDDLGYVLFKLSDVLRIARVVARNGDPGTYGGENRSGRKSSAASRISS